MTVFGTQTQLCPETQMWAVAAKPGQADAENGGEQIKMEKEANR